MHAAIQLFAYWAISFLTLGIAVAFLNFFSGLIGNDLVLRSFGAEAAVAGAASLVEAASIWLVASFVPSAARALIIPALIVALLYKMTHLEDWSRYDVLMLLGCQIVIAWFGVSLAFGHFQTAIIILAGFAVVLAVFASFARSL